MGYKVKPSKSSCEFWRHERRVKKSFNPDIIERKLEMERLKRSISNIEDMFSETVQQQGNSRWNLHVTLAVNAREKNRFNIDLAPHYIRGIRGATNSWKKHAKRSDKLCSTLIHLLELRNKLHRECLAIRCNERKGT